MYYLLNCNSKSNRSNEKNMLIIQIVLKGLIIIFFKFHNINLEFQSFFF